MCMKALQEFLNAMLPFCDSSHNSCIEALEHDIHLLIFLSLQLPSLQSHLPHLLNGTLERMLPTTLKLRVPAPQVFSGKLELCLLFLNNSSKPLCFSPFYIAGCVAILVFVCSFNFILSFNIDTFTPYFEKDTHDAFFFFLQLL